MIAGSLGPRIAVQESALLRLAIDGLEVVDVDGDVVRARSLGVLTLEQVELLVAECQPEHRPFELRRRQPAHAEQLFVEARRLLEVVCMDRHVIDAQRSHEQES